MIGIYQVGQNEEHLSQREIIPVLCKKQKEDIFLICFRLIIQEVGNVTIQQNKLLKKPVFEESLLVKYRRLKRRQLLPSLFMEYLLAGKNLTFSLSNGILQRIFIKHLYYFRSCHQRFSIKLFLEVSQNSKENTCARVSFLIKLQVSGLQRY